MSTAFSFCSHNYMGGLSELSSSHKKLHVHLLYCLLGIQFTYIVFDRFAYHHFDDPLLACVCSNSPHAHSSAAAIMRANVHQVEAVHKTHKLCIRREDYYNDNDEDEDKEIGQRGALNSLHKNSIIATSDRDDGEKTFYKGAVALQNATAKAEGDESTGGLAPQRQRRHNAWHQMKWVGQPARCLVRGKLIERLDEESNFRRGYALKFVEDVEDKTHLLPWLLGSKVNLNSRKRRVYIDLGANRFTTSVRWFLRMYPCDFTEIHAFEANRRAWRVPTVAAHGEEGNELAEMSNRSVRVRKKPGIPKWMMERIHVYYKLAAHRDDEERGMVNMTRFIKEELGLRKGEDTAVVVKMDVEGSEWPLLRAWMEDPEMPAIVDELFVEAHYAHPSMRAFGWDSFSPISRPDAKRLLADLRWRGFYAHAWP